MMKAALGFFLLATSCLAARAQDVLPVEQAFIPKAEAIAAQTIALDWRIADGYYLYKDKILVSATDARIARIEYAEAETKHDEFFGEMVVYRDEAAKLKVFLDPHQMQTLVLETQVQGCHEREPRICYPPYRQRLTVDLPLASIAAAPASVQAVRDLPTATGFGLASADPLANTEPSPLPEDQAFHFEAISSPPDGILARFTMPKGYYLYRDKTAFEAQAQPSIKLGAPRWPISTSLTDAHFGEVSVFFDTVEVPLPIATADFPEQARKIRLTAHFQGCQQEGICYPPMKRDIELDIPAPTQFAMEARNDGQRVQAAPPESEQDRFQSYLAGSNRLWAVVLFFIAGLGLAFTPCVLPMLPILSGIIAGAGANLTKKRALWLSSIYVIASALVFAVIGIIAGIAGKNLQTVLQTPAVLTAFAALFVLLALGMFGFYELQLPSWLQNRVNSASNRQKAGSTMGVMLMGFLSALLVGPCVAPPLAGAVLYIGQKQDPYLGGAALFAMAIGMGLPLIAFGISAGHLMPRAGAWMNAIKTFFGVVFLWLALWMLERVLDPVWIMLLAGMLLIGSAVHLGALEKLPESASRWPKLRKAFGLALLVLGIIQFIGVASGGRDYWRPLSAIGALRGSASMPRQPLFSTIKTPIALEQALAAARKQGKPAILDFYADWCVECKRMERNTFADARVVQALGDFVSLKVDVTAQSADDIEIQKRYQIIGPPGTLFFGCQDGERSALRLVGYEGPTEFIARVSRAKRC